MKRRTAFWIICCSGAIALNAGCSGTQDAEGLQGRWVGQIICLGDTSDLTLGITSVDGTQLYGSGLIRTKNSNVDYTAKGEQQTVTLTEECQDPFCQSAADCAGKLDKSGTTGKSRCVEMMCTPCFEKMPRPQVTLTLQDANIQIPDPLLELLRYGSQRLEGTVKRFCADEAISPPRVKLEKD